MLDESSVNRSGSFVYVCRCILRREPRPALDVDSCAVDRLKLVLSDNRNDSDAKQRNKLRTGVRRLEMDNVRHCRAMASGL